MTAGVHLNGHEYKQGDWCGVVKTNPRRPGSPATYHVGRVENFLVFPGIVFVRLSERPVLEKRFTYYIHQNTDGFMDCGNLLVHIDNVTAKMHVVPHFDDAEKVCSIHVWDAR